MSRRPPFRFDLLRRLIPPFDPDANSFESKRSCAPRQRFASGVAADPALLESETLR